MCIRDRSKKLRKNVNRAMNLLNDYQQDKYDKVQRKEDLIDKYESRLGEYLIQLTKREMNTAQTTQVSLYLHTINDLSLIHISTGNLDPKTSEEIMKLLEQINERGTTVLVVTHNKEIVNQMKKRVVTMHDGVIISDEKEGGYHEA